MEKALEIRKEIGDKNGDAAEYENLGNIVSFPGRIRTG